MAFTHALTSVVLCHGLIDYVRDTVGIIKVVADEHPFVHSGRNYTYPVTGPWRGVSVIVPEVVTVHCTGAVRSINGEMARQAPLIRSAALLLHRHMKVEDV